MGNFCACLDSFDLKAQVSKQRRIDVMRETECRDFSVRTGRIFAIMVKLADCYMVLTIWVDYMDSFVRESMGAGKRLARINILKILPNGMRCFAHGSKTINKA